MTSSTAELSGSRVELSYQVRAAREGVARTLATVFAAARAAEDDAELLERIAVAVGNAWALGRSLDQLADCIESPSTTVRRA